ncbi:protein CsuA [Acinetobacter defluvii]|uniref:Spore coat protein U domain-containing protein n=1 Tax=Acinetobacter defluvii TaxID=1871111 RepID=A0A2S2FA03_9GAMM|nr:spore coat U domain-containing protein [Acinetobacter defluvii]AWL27708.1 spore coat protein U domain-containing protein [Acinetobacter defluvii]NNP74325.1 protein CsuA [Acinetobacter defluvii]
MKKTHVLASGLLVASSLLAAPAMAAITGQVDVKLKISAGCTVENAEVEGNMNKFGVLDFGQSSSTWANVLTAEVASAGDGGDLTVVCDESVGQFNVSVNGGERSNRTLSNATDTVNYNVYQDAGRTQLYAIDQNVPFTVGTGNTPVKVPMFGAVPANATAVSEGDYKDTLLVTVSF